MSARSLGRGVDNGSQFSSLSDIDVRTSQGAVDAMKVLDKSINEVAKVRAELGAFQTHTLESNLSSLRVHSENLVASESVIRDADMAKEIVEFTKNRVQVEASTAVLDQANSLPDNILRLLD